MIKSLILAGISKLSEQPKPVRVTIVLVTAAVLGATGGSLVYALVGALV